MRSISHQDRHKNAANLTKLGLSIFVQLVAVVSLAAAINLLGTGPWLIAVYIVATVSCSSLLKLGKIWSALNLVIGPATVLLISYPVSTELIAVFSIFICLLFLPTLWTRVPYYPTEQRIYSTIGDYLPQNSNFKFIDLGCGSASLLSYLAKRFPNSEFTGYEISPLAFLASKLLTLNQRNNITVKFKSFWGVNLSSSSHVYAFLSPTPMPELYKKLSSELKPGAVLIANSFAVPEIEPAQTISSGSSQTLIIYKF